MFLSFTNKTFSFLFDFPTLLVCCFVLFGQLSKSDFKLSKFFAMSYGLGFAPRTSWASATNGLERSNSICKTQQSVLFPHDNSNHFVFWNL